MFATRQAEQHTLFTGGTDSLRPRGWVTCCREGRSSLPDRRRLLEAPADIAGQHRTGQRFVRETESIRDFLIQRAGRLTLQRADAEDLVQDTLLKAYLSFDGYRDGTNLKSWLDRIMVNTWIDRYRSAQRRPTEQLAANFTDTQLAASASHSSSGGVAESAEAQALRSLPGDAELAMQTLSDELRETVYYADIAGYRNTEIAELLNIPVGTVGSRLHRGRAVLRGALADPSVQR